MGSPNAAACAIRPPTAADGLSPAEIAQHREDLRVLDGDPRTAGSASRPAWLVRRVLADAQEGVVSHEATAYRVIRRGPGPTVKVYPDFASHGLANHVAGLAARKYPGAVVSVEPLELELTSESPAADDLDGDCPACAECGGWCSDCNRAEEIADDVRWDGADE